MKRGVTKTTMHTKHGTTLHFLPSQASKRSGTLGDCPFGFLSRQKHLEQQWGHFRESSVNHQARFYNSPLACWGWGEWEREKLTAIEARRVTTGAKCLLPLL